MPVFPIIYVSTIDQVLPRVQNMGGAPLTSNTKDLLQMSTSNLGFEPQKLIVYFKLNILIHILKCIFMFKY